MKSRCVFHGACGTGPPATKEVPLEERFGCNSSRVRVPRVRRRVERFGRVDRMLRLLDVMGRRASGR